MGERPLGERAPPLLRLEHVSKRFGPVTAVDDLTLDIRANEFFALLGPSGCGKTTLLRLIAGFETPDRGRIALDGQDIAAVPPHQRPVNMMFQSYALFPHLNVEKNIGFGLRQEGVRRREMRERIDEMLTLTQLQGYATRRIDQLSGGQRQRVALARALIKRPRVLLLDEPMAALDKKLRGETRFELMRLQRKLGTSFIIVTHDQEEAMIVADRIAVMRDGRLVQVDDPASIYEKPNSRWVADFIGEVTIDRGPARLRAHRDRDAARAPAHRAPARCCGPAPRSRWRCGRRSCRFSPHRPGATPGNALAGTIAEIGYRGDVSLYKVQLADRSLVKVALANTSPHGEAPFDVGDVVWVTWPAEAGVVLKE